MSRILGILDSGALVRRARRDAAVALQSCWRGKSARLRIARSREAREVLRGEAYGAAATVLQAAVRGRLGCMDAQGKRNAANILKVCFSQCLCWCRLDLLYSFRNNLNHPCLAISCPLRSHACALISERHSQGRVSRHGSSCTCCIPTPAARQTSPRYLQHA